MRPHEPVPKHHLAAIIPVGISSWRHRSFVAAAVALALVVAAWFALGISEAHQVNAVTSELAGSTHLSSQQVRSADATLSSAGTLNPDQNVKLLRGEVALSAGQMLAARRIFLEVAHDEPLSIDAWAWVLRAAGSDHPLIRLALGNIARLSPRLVPH